MKSNDNSILENLSSEELNNIVKRIIHLRSSILKMTQLQFSNTVNISQTYLSMIENGKKAINIATVDQIVTSLNIDFNWLVFGVGEDCDIFLSDDINMANLRHSMRTKSLHDIQKAFDLKSKEIDFLSWFLCLDSKDKQRFISSLTSITDLLK